MRVTPEDRRNFGQFGLAVLVIGLVVAPLSHILGDHAGLSLASAEDGHQHGHSHPSEPSGPRPHTHHDGSLQHLTAVFSAPAAPPAVVQIFASSWPALRAPEQRALAAAVFTPAMPQGP
jgi:hypothetical protein